MRKSNSAAVAADSNAARDRAPTLLVCVALALSLAMLAGRILSVW
jgi:hypothetical protein